MSEFYGYSPAGAQESVRGNRMYWDGHAPEYLAEHGDFLAGDVIWGPEGTRESEHRFLGSLEGRRVLEIGSGAAGASQWVRQQGADVCASDLSWGMLSTDWPGRDRQLSRIVADGQLLPFADRSFDVVFTAHGVLAFVPDLEVVFAEVHRVLKPDGRWVYSAPHPMRWIFPDDPSSGGLTAVRSYFERVPYIEKQGELVTYAEHHRTMADHMNALIHQRFSIEGLHEPKWSAGEATWDGFSAVRGEIFPSTMLVQSRRP